VEFLNGVWSRGLADPLPMGVEPAPGAEPAMATHLNASHLHFPPLELKRSLLQTPPRQDHPSVPHSGRVRHEEEVWGDRTFSQSRMDPCVVVKGQRSLGRSDAANPMGRCVWSLRPASLTVARVPYAYRVKDMAPPPKNRVGSARSCIPCHRGDQRSSRLRAFLLLVLTRSCGEMGHALSLVVTG